MGKYSVEIDCQPGITRPGDIFNTICENCNLKEDWFNKPTKIFGNWEWIVKPEYEEIYKEHQYKVKEQLTQMYNNGSVRYASW